MNKLSIAKTSMLAVTVSAMVAGCQNIPETGSKGGMDNTGVYTGAVSGSGDYFLGNSYTTVAPANQKYYFAYDDFSVHQEYMPSIKAQAQYLASHSGAKIRLEGHTDERGSREYNIGLGERRAMAVAQLLKMDGAAKSQISVVSYGAERPAVVGHDESAYRMNRRVDVIYEVK